MATITLTLYDQLITKTMAYIEHSDPRNPRVSVFFKYLDHIKVRFKRHILKNTRTEDNIYSFQ